MKFFKENPIFAVLVSITVIALIAGGVLGFLASGDLAKAKKKVTQAEQALRSQLSHEPSATQENLSAVQANVAELDAQLQSYIGELQKGGKAAPQFAGDPSTFPLFVDRFRNEYIEKAKEISVKFPGGQQSEPEEERFSLFVADDQFFGFERFRESPPPVEHVNRIYLQSLVVQYMLDKLFVTIEKGDDVDVISVLREPVYDAPKELTAKKNLGGSKDGMFLVSKVVSAREEGAINTMGFRVIFNGRSNNLRGFLQAIATEEEWPLVVRSVEVEPAQEIVTRTVDKAADTADVFAAMFGGIGGGKDKKEAEEEKVPEKLPIVDNTVSKFTITLEYIEIVEDNAEEVAVDDEFAVTE